MIGAVRVWASIIEESLFLIIAVIVSRVFVITCEKSDKPSKIIKLPGSTKSRVTFDTMS